MLQTFGIACHRIMHDIGIILQLFRCISKAMSIALDCLIDEVAVSTMLRYITQTMVAPYFLRCIDQRSRRAAPSLAACNC